MKWTSVGESCWGNRTSINTNWRPKEQDKPSDRSQHGLSNQSAAVQSKLCSTAGCNNESVTHAACSPGYIFHHYYYFYWHTLYKWGEKRSYNFIGYWRCLAKQSFSIMPRRKKDLTSSRGRGSSRGLFTISREHEERESKNNENKPEQDVRKVLHHIRTCGRGINLLTLLCSVIHLLKKTSLEPTVYKIF